MEKRFPGNNNAYISLSYYVQMKHPAPLILLGNRGLGKKDAALSVSAHLLGTSIEELHASRDFFVLDRGREWIKVEDVLDILEKSTLAPLNNVNVFLICHADRMNVQAQNKLLKLLEDRNSGNIVIFLCDQDMLISTIKSRCMIVEFHPLCDAEMAEYLKEKGIRSDLDFIAHLCSNCPCLLEEIMPVYPSLKEAYCEMKSLRRREDLLSVFHLVQEKDPSEFYSVHASHYSAALQMVLHLFYGMMQHSLHPAETIGLTEDFGFLPGLYTLQELLKVCTAITAHQRRWLTGNYTKNDFFDLVRTMILCSG